MDPLINAKKAALCFNQLHFKAAICQSSSVQQVARFGDGYLRSLLESKFKFAIEQNEPPNKRRCPLPKVAHILEGEVDSSREDAY